MHTAGSTGLRNRRSSACGMKKSAALLDISNTPERYGRSNGTPSKKSLGSVIDFLAPVQDSAVEPDDSFSALELAKDATVKVVSATAKTITGTSSDILSLFSEIVSEMGKVVTGETSFFDSPPGTDPKVLRPTPAVRSVAAPPKSIRLTSQLQTPGSGEKRKREQQQAMNFTPSKSPKLVSLPRAPLALDFDSSDDWWDKKSPLHGSLASLSSSEVDDTSQKYIAPTNSALLSNLRSLRINDRCCSDLADATRAATAVPLIPPPPPPAMTFHAISAASDGRHAKHMQWNAAVVDRLIEQSATAAAPMAAAPSDLMSAPLGMHKSGQTSLAKPLSPETLANPAAAAVLAAAASKSLPAPTTPRVATSEPAVRGACIVLTKDELKPRTQNEPKPPAVSANPIAKSLLKNPATKPGPGAPAPPPPPPPPPVRVYL